VAIVMRVATFTREAYQASRGRLCHIRGCPIGHRILVRSFDPPVPPKERAIVVVARTAGLTALAIAWLILRMTWLYVVVLAVGALVALVRHAQGYRPVRRRRGDPPPFVVPPDLHLTAAPEVVDGGVACCGCDAVVPFDSMSINEDGYFCRACARAA
jgi:hypothetical protein